MRWIGLDLSQWEKSGYRPKDQIVRGTFRTTLTVHDAKGRMEIRLTAVNRYRLTVNGCTILHGPARAARMQCYLDTVDLSGMLRTGENRIEILVEAYPSLPATSEHDGPQNLYRYDRGPMIAAASECFPEISQADAWTIIPDAGYTPNMQFPLLAGPTERDDLRKTMRADGVMAKSWGRRAAIRGVKSFCRPFWTNRSRTCFARKRSFGACRCFIRTQVKHRAWCWKLNR